MSGEVIIGFRRKSKVQNPKIGAKPQCIHENYEGAFMFCFALRTKTVRQQVIYGTFAFLLLCKFCWGYFIVVVLMLYRLLYFLFCLSIFGYVFSCWMYVYTVRLQRTFFWLPVCLFNPPATLFPMAYRFVCRCCCFSFFLCVCLLLFLRYLCYADFVQF